MSEKFVEDVEAKIREKLGNKSFKWSSDVDLELIEDKRTVVMAIKDDNYQKNMQTNAACFEGWAAVLKTYYMGNEYDIVELKCDSMPFPKEGKLNKDKDKDKDKDENNKFDHANRFLYRALRFSEQYKDWFRLEKTLQRKVEAFKNYLEKSKGKLLNNVPNKKASDTEAKVASEYVIECLMVDKKIMFAPVFSANNGNSSFLEENLRIGHQLPVGLFEGEVTSKNEKQIFSGKAAAIDLWAYHSLQPNEFYIFELKFQNKMLGIISETFFYANYMYDLLTQKGCFTLNKQGNQNYRDYDTLIKCEHDNKIDTINAVMLADKGNMHPAITKELLEVLNNKQGVSINYLRAEYEAEIILLGSIDVSK